MDFKDQEIFISGKASDGRVITDNDISELVEGTLQAIETSNHKIPLKLGHSDRDQWAKGWVQNIRKIGSKIVADFINIPVEIADKVKNGYLPNKSIEYVEGYITKLGHKLKKVIDGVALLGIDQPAIPWLNDNDTQAVFCFSSTKYIDKIDLINDELERRGWIYKLFTQSNPNWFPFVPSGTVKKDWTDKDIDENETQYRCRVMNPSDFKDGTLRQIDIDTERGIYAIVGKLESSFSTTIQSYRFDRQKWGIADVVNWLNTHKK